MPTQHSQRWIDDCENMKMQLEALGYTVYDQFAENDVNQQISQVEKFIEQKVDCLVIAAVDSYALSVVLKKAKEKYADLADILFILRINLTTLCDAVKPQCYGEWTKWNCIYKREDTKNDG